MTVQPSAQPDRAADPAVKMVSLTIDDIPVMVAEGTLVIRAAEQIGVQIPRFCDHPLLEPIGACRQCLVEVPDAGNGRPIPKPQASCTLPVAEGMVVRTQHTSPISDKAQQGIMEFLLVNHPLDCPMCDKGGECPLQNQAMSNGRGESRYHDPKRTYAKPINISPEILLDRERCILCTRCTRFSEEIPGDPMITMNERGWLQQVAVYEKQPFESYFSGNTIQICPVGALTSTAYRFRSRPFDLVSTPSVCEHCASGCALRTDHRRGKVLRRLAGDDPEVNEEWNCDKGRFGFTYPRVGDRLERPLVRDEDSGELRVASWPEALAVAARGLQAAEGAVGVLAGGRLTAEDAYAYGKFARAVLETNDVDFRARPMSAEEAEFLAAHVAASPGVSYADLERASAVLLVGLEPEEESPIIFLRLRKAVRRHKTRIYSIASHTSPGLAKLSGRLLRSTPGREAAAVAGVADDGEIALDGGGVILVGERMATSPGTLAAVAQLAATTGAALGWVPRRAGERGALEAGVLPNLLPGGRPLSEAGARVDLAAAWGVEGIPAEPGRDTEAILSAAASGDLGALVVGGVQVDDLPDPAGALEALDRVGFLVSLEIRESAVTERADVILPVAAVDQKAGTFVDWEGRLRPFGVVLDSSMLTDTQVLAGIADELGRPLGFSTVDQARRELTELGPWDGERPVPAMDTAPAEPDADPRPIADSGEAVLSTWRLLVDDSRGVDGEPYLQATAREPVAVLSPATLEALGVGEGQAVTVATDVGSLTLPAHAGDIGDGVVWVPANSGGVSLLRDLRATAGSLVRVEGGVE